MHKKTRFFCAQVTGEQPAIWGLKASSEIARNVADCAPDAMFYWLCMKYGLTHNMPCNALWCACADRLFRPGRSLRCPVRDTPELLRRGINFLCPDEAADKRSASGCGRGIQQCVRVKADHLLAQPVINVLHRLHHRHQFVDRKHSCRLLHITK